MDAPDFTEFMLSRIHENPEEAQLLNSILSCYKKGLIEAFWNSDIEDFLFNASPLGEDVFYENITKNFIPAEAQQA